MTNKQALDELLPCFGCKSVDISLTHIHGVRWGVQCHDCDLHTDPDAKTKEEATAHWNRYFRWFLVDIPERSMMQDRTEEYDDGYLNGFHDGQKSALTQPNQALVEEGFAHCYGCGDSKPVATGDEKSMAFVALPHNVFLCENCVDTAAYMVAQHRGEAQPSQTVVEGLEKAIESCARLIPTIELHRNKFERTEFTAETGHGAKYGDIYKIIEAARAYLALQGGD